MPVTPRPLASAIMHPTRSVMIPTTAGHQVRFQRGMATINDTNDLPFLLRRSDVRMVVNEYAMSWMPEVLAKVYKIEATVEWPEGYDVAHRNGDDFSITSPVDEPPVDALDPLDPLDPLDQVLKEKPKWRKPRSNSSES